MKDAVATLALTRRHESSAANTFRLVPNPPVFVRGEGPYLFTATGERFLDLVCGSATTNLGHGHPAHSRAIEAALATGILHTGTRLPSPFRAALYEALVSILPPGLDCVQLVNSGAEAIETAIKVAQFATGRRRIVAFEGGYHGRTLGALSITDNARIRTPFQTLDHLVDVLPYPDGSAAGAALGAAAELLARRKREGDLPALIVIEAVQGISGVLGPHTAFLEGLQQLANTFDVPLAVDEIWNGFGRTGRWFSYELAGLEPDLVVMGKALTGGLPLSAVASGPRFLKAWPPGMHTSTFQGNPIACAMAVATIETIRSEHLLAHVDGVVAAALAARLRTLEGAPGVAAIRICGAQAAIALVSSDGKPDATRSGELQKRLLERGILAYGGGRNGDCLMLLPPINIDRATLAAALDVVVEALL